jgi:molecular chaperone HtpG
MSQQRLASPLKDYVGGLKENQTAIYYLAGDDVARLENSPYLEGFRARGVVASVTSYCRISLCMASALTWFL